MALNRNMGTIPPLLTTAVGSMPHENPFEAVELILQSLQNAPHIPQLSKTDFKEQMWIQCSEGLPRFKVDFDERKFFFDTCGDVSGDLEPFYSEYLEVLEGSGADYFAISPEYGKGLHTFLEVVRDSGRKYPYIKLQVTGPLSFSLTITDQENKAIFYDPIFRDVAVKGMGLKAVWLIELFRPYADQIILFFDEPCLSAYGSSAYMGLSRNDVIECLNDVISLVKSRGAIPGVHCCGNTDWSLLMATDTSIINFDAVDYMDSLPIYSNDLRRFVEEGGTCAFGAVPNTRRVVEDTSERILDRINQGLSSLVQAGINRNELTSRIIVTPACGCAGMTDEEVKACYKVLAELDKLTSIG